MACQFCGNQVKECNDINYAMKNYRNYNQTKVEKVDHPSHYGGDTTYEVIKVLKEWLTTEQYQGFLLGNSIKYQARYRHKGGIEDLKKAQWYLNKYLEEFKS